MDPKIYRKLIEAAFDEDLGDRGDVTSSAVFSDELSSTALWSKDTGVLAGSEVFTAAMKYVDEGTNVEFVFRDGGRLEPGNLVASISGKTLSMLKAERVALNFLSFLSGIASRTRIFADAAVETGSAVILDTRKTLPGFRELSKYAVRMGGGRNHRMGLYDMVLIKDNHIDLCGSITASVDRVRNKWGDRFRIEVECRNLDEVGEALACGVDVIMLDNMDARGVEAAVTLRTGNVQFEVSGNMDIESVKRMSAAGADLISVGKLTHSVTAFDFSLKSGAAPKER